MAMQPQTFLISRTDSIGDVVLTLPMAAAIKQHFPHAKVGFLGKAYTKPVIAACQYVDAFIDVKDFLNEETSICGAKIDCIIHVLPRKEIAQRAKKLGIPLRIGTKNRLYHWWTCNKLVSLSRKNSDLHEAELNMVLLSPFFNPEQYSADTIPSLYGFTQIEPLAPDFQQLLSPDKTNVILHPKSQGNGREWPMDYYIQLIRGLDLNKFKIFISGVEKDRAALSVLFSQIGDRVTDLCGKMSLSQFISFIAHAQALVASGTGPLHIASALGIHALGMYPPIRPIHPGRWRPLGFYAHTFVAHRECDKCNIEQCTCMLAITPVEIQNTLEKI